MIEDPELTLEILRYFAQGDIGFPANKSDYDVHEAFQDKSFDEIQYHLYCALEAGLLHGKDPNECRIVAARGVGYSFGNIDGLTPLGGEYVRNAKSFWLKAKIEIAKRKLPLTTTILNEMMRAMVQRLLS